jgi:DNA polymerase-3 subunit delta'
VSFEEIVGQPGPERALRAALRTGRIAGGYLFLGPRGVGKLRTALVFARALLCDGPGEEDSCDACRACRRARSRVHPCLHVVGEGDGVAEVKVEEVRAVQDRLSLKPMEGARQVVVVDNADRMNEVAANALLKTLEEPPPGATLILVAAEPLRVLETVRSRCHPVRFRSLARESVRAVLEGEGLAAEEADALARLAGGSPGRALALRALGFPQRGETVARRFLDVGRADPAEIAADLAGGEDRPSNRAEARRAARETLFHLAHLAREAMVASVGGDPRTGTEDVVGTALRRFGRNPDRWGKVLRRLLETADTIRANVSVETALLDLLLDLETAWKSLGPNPPPSPSRT